jgi:hypothetical protein
VDRHCEPTGRANARPMTGSAKQSRAPTVIASEAKQSILPRKERMDCFVASAPRNDVDGQESAFSRLDPPEVCPNVSRLEIRGRGECRMRAAPAVSCANGKRKAHEHTGSAKNIRHSLRNGFNGFLRALPGVSGFLASVAFGYGTSAPGRADTPPKT